MSVSAIRRLLFDSALYAVIGCEEYDNSEARALLYAIKDQDAGMNVINNGTHLLIW